MNAKNIGDQNAANKKKRSVIFSDGACSKNPGPGAWAFVLLDAETNHVIEKAGFEADSTNNRMELCAATEGLRALATRGVSGEIVCYTDSKLLIEGITKWIHGWKKRDWIKSDGAAVLNQDHWKALEKAVEPFKGRLSWQYVPGHSDVLGNLRVDELAVALTKLKEVSLYEGTLAAYPHSEIFSQDISHHGASSNSHGAKANTLSAEKSSKFEKVVYLSLVNGILERHQSWAECEARVKGAKGAKFKKVKNTTEEKAVLASWGLD